MKSSLQDTPAAILNENILRRRTTERWRHCKNEAAHPPKSTAAALEAAAAGKSEFALTQPPQPPKQWVSSCGCVHNILNEDEKPKSKEDMSCGGCGCICGDGHRHYNQKFGTECQLICCNAHGLRVNRSRPKGRGLFMSRKCTWASVTV